MKSRLAAAILAGTVLFGSGGVVQAELIAYYTFEGNANDVSGNGHDGVASDVSTVPGYEGQAFHFSGGFSDTGSHVDIPSLDINPAALPRLTMGAWVKWDGSGGAVQQIITHDDGGFDRSVGIDNRFSSGLRWSAFNGSGAVASTIEPTQDWTFVAIVYDDAAASATLYVNGESFPTPTYFGPGEAYTVIGRNPGELGPGESGEYFRGTIDNLFFFDEALTAEQVADIRQNGVHAPNTTVVTVDGKASVYQIFGHPGSYWNDALDAVRVEVTPGTVAFRFSVSGGIHCAGSTGGVGTADGLNDGFCGAQPMNTQPYNGLSGVVGDLWFGLMGVFTTEADPYGQVPPEPIPFDADIPTSLSPALHQVFYIGDGRAGRDDLNGATLTFTPPAGTTRLYLGYYDGFGGEPTGYADNVGSMTATIMPEGAGDSTPPIVQPTVIGTLGNNGWYVSDVQVAWTVTDAESAISETTGCEASSVTSDSAGMTFTCSATSLGGTTTESVTIKRDTMPPTATATAGPPPNAAGWNRTNVTVTFTGTDATSGVESCDPPVILKTNGTDQSASGRCYDFAGNQSDLATASGINIDKTKPTVVITSPANGAVYSVGEVVLASYFCDDALSGIVSCVGTVADGQAIDTSKVSPVRKFKVTGKDAAGNSKSVTVKYAVQ